MGMKKMRRVLAGAIFGAICLLCGCNSSNVDENKPREEVLEKYSDGTAELEYLEDMYEKYPEDEVIAHIYYYAMAKEYYEFYETFDEEVEYTIVGSSESNPVEFKISDESPIGRALIGASIGEVVKAETPGGEIVMKILEISK